MSFPYICNKKQYRGYSRLKIFKQAQGRGRPALGKCGGEIEVALVIYLS